MYNEEVYKMYYLKVKIRR